MNELEITTPMSAATLREQVRLIQDVMKEVMQGPSKDEPNGVHYGIIPGCKKPSLYKAGAEKLSMVFRLRPVMESGRDVIMSDLGNGHREITVYCHIYNMVGVELATGIGSCSTMESKHRYRGGEKKPTGRPVPKEYWNLRDDGKIQEAKESIGGEGFGVSKNDGKWEIVEFGAKMENPDIADQYNTVLKMAKKRAYVDGILSATAASDIFTQDVEDMAHVVTTTVETTAQTVKTETSAPSVEMPKKTVETTAEPDESEPVPADLEKISEKQARRFYMLWKGAGKTREQVLAYLKENVGVEVDKNIPKVCYEKACEWAESK